MRDQPIVNEAFRDLTPLLEIVVPCYNEEEVLPRTYLELHRVLLELKAKGDIREESRLLFVDDGSRDRTWESIEQLAATQLDVVGLRLARNTGHQNALLAGLTYSSGDAVLSIDADLQDDVDAIPEMVKQWRNGCDIVYGVRRRRDVDTAFKRKTAKWYYAILRAMGVSIVPDHADFRLMTRAAVLRLLSYDEVNLFLRGIVPLVGSRTGQVFYDRRERLAGETKYPLRRMLALAVDGITSFTAFPLRVISAIGLFVFLLSIAMTGWVLWTRWFTDNAIPGWASSVIPIYFIGGVQLLSLGVLGEYVAKIYLESKRRPRFFIETIVGERGAADENQSQLASALKSARL